MDLELFHKSSLSLLFSILFVRWNVNLINNHPYLYDVILQEVTSFMVGEQQYEDP